MRKHNKAMAARYPVSRSSYIDADGVFDEKGYKRAKAGAPSMGHYFANNKGFQLHAHMIWANLAVSMLPKGACAQV